MKNSSSSTRSIAGKLACVCLAASLFSAGLRDCFAGSATLSFGGSWSQNQASVALNSFQTWAEKYAATTALDAKSQLVPDGVAAAQARRAALASLIQTDPEKALLAAVPMSVRASLPPEVVAELETRISGIGDFNVVCAFPAKNGGPTTGITRNVVIDGKKYRAFVYGRRAAETTKNGIALQGIVVDDFMAVSENSLRVLEASEAIAAGKKIVDFSRGAANGPLAEVDGTIYRFASIQDLQQAEAQLENNEAGFNPQPKAGTFQVLQSVTGAGVNPRNDPTPWTTGLKSILVIRVDFSDATGDPTDASGNALTAAYVQGIADNQVAPYYPKSSFGLTSMTNTVTTQLYRMPQTASSYASSGDNNQLHIDAETLASADYAVTNYDRIIVVFANLSGFPGSLINYGGLALIGGKSVWVNGEFDFRVVAHELGHTYGLFHAGLWQVNDGNPISPSGTTIEYGDDFDTMGANFADSFDTDFSAFGKNMLGWIRDSQVKPITTNGVYRVYTFDWRN